MDGSEVSVDTLPPDLPKWVIDLNADANEVDLRKEEEDWKKPSIYRVTSFARRHNPNAFTPQVISFGPFHHGSEPLKATEVAKHRALTHFLHRAGKRSEPFVSELRRILTQLQDSYQDLAQEWKDNSNEFLQMMLHDGCFMIEVLRTNESSYAPNDPVFSSQMNPLRKPYIKRDMLLLENQLPLLVLKALLEVENRGRTDDKYINDLVLSYCGETLKANLPRLASHPLELYRMSLLHEDTIIPVRSHPIIETQLIENAVELWESGVHFSCNNNASLRNINFNPKTGRLVLPVLPVHDGTEHLLLNMVAYEQIQVGAGNDITSYVMFMDALIDTADDVKLLQKKKIINSSLASHKDVADLFNRLPKEVANDAPNNVFNQVRFDLSKYHENRGNKWLASLQHEYLHSPWKVISIFAAAFAIVLTFIQTIYSCLGK